MKNVLLTVSLLTSISLFSQKEEYVFRRTEPISEVMELYIKTQLEGHTEGTNSSIKILPIHNYQEPMKANYLEFAAYKQGSAKTMVILSGGRTLDKTTRKYNFQSPKFISLSEEQCKKIVEKYEGLIAQVKGASPIPNETVYADYTVSSEMFISFKTTPKGLWIGSSVDIYIAGTRFNMPTLDFITAVSVYLKY